MRILLIDDDAELCALLTELFRRESFDLDTAHDGRRGLDLARTGNYGMIVLDVMWPAWTGSRCCASSGAAAASRF